MMSLLAGSVYNEFWTDQPRIRCRIVGVRQNGFLFYSIATLYFLICKNSRKQGVFQCLREFCVILFQY